MTSIDQLDFSRQYTYADYLQWKFQERLELIRGYIYKMSPAPARRHQDISRNLGRQIDKYLLDLPCQWYTAPFDVRLPRRNKNGDDEIMTVVQPDICIVCDPLKLDDRGCIGAPDVIIEILSPGNTKKEMFEKFQVYEEAGVKEYWLVEPADKIVLIYTLNEEGKYIGKRPFTEEEKMSSFVFPGLVVDLNDVFVD